MRAGSPRAQRLFVGRWIAAAALLAVTPSAAQAKDPPTITGLSSPGATRSGYVEVFGSGFEPTGRLVIGGIDAIVTDWRSDRVIGYVPESAALGAATVQVWNSAGGSNPETLQVTQRQPDGRIRWSFRMTAPYSKIKPALGADGTLYIVDVYDHLYAVGPDGALRWAVGDAGEKGVGVGIDGSVYTTSSYEVKAYTSGGQLGWTYDIVPSGFVSVALEVGPDGNVYVLASQGRGVFALSPDGELLWTDPEEYDRPTISYPEMKFGPNDGQTQLYFYANGHVPAIGIHGGQRNCEIWHAYRSPVDVGPDGSIHMVNHAWTPDCQLLWEFDLGNNRPNDTRNGPGVSVGPDGIHYMIVNGIHFYAIRSDGSQRWHLTLDDPLKAPDVDPTNTRILFGGATTGNQSGYVVSRSTKNGKEQWRHTFAAVDGFNHFVDTRPRFTPDGEIAYISTWHGTGGENASYFHAFDVTANGDCPVPAQVQGVAFRASPTRIEWDEVEPGAVYDVVRGSLADLAAGGAGPGCLENNISQTWVDDLGLPAPGEGWYYGVRGGNGCGQGSWGRDSAGYEREYGACP